MTRTLLLILLSCAPMLMSCAFTVPADTPATPFAGVSGPSSEARMLNSMESMTEAMDRLANEVSMMRFELQRSREELASAEKRSSLEQLQIRRTELLVWLAEARTQMTDEHPDVLSAELQLAVLDREIAKRAR